MRCVLLTGILAFQGAALAQDAQPANPLSGPKVESPAEKPTLVQRDFNGWIKTLDEPAEEAALRLLPLSDDERAKTDAVIRERAAILDGVIRDNLVLLLRIQGLRLEGEAKEDATAALRELAEKLRPLRERGAAKEEIAGKLSAENAAKFRSLFDEYWRSVIEEAVADAKKEDPDVRPGAVVAKERLKAIGAEIKRSYDHQIAARQGELDALIKSLGLTGEQEGKIRNMTTDYFQKTAGKPTPDQRREFFRALMKELAPSQREELLRQLYGAGETPRK